jgi:hypothetical protein
LFPRLSSAANALFAVLYDAFGKKEKSLLLLFFFLSLRKKPPTPSTPP